MFDRWHKPSHGHARRPRASLRLPRQVLAAKRGVGKMDGRGDRDAPIYKSIEFSDGSVPETFRRTDPSMRRVVSRKTEYLQGKNSTRVSRRVTRCRGRLRRPLPSPFGPRWPRYIAAPFPVNEVLNDRAALVSLARLPTAHQPTAVTWLILPVVICLSQRLSHACLSTSSSRAKLRMAH